MSLVNYTKEFSLSKKLGWTKQIKMEYDGLRHSGKSEEEAKKILKKKYKLIGNFNTGLSAGSTAISAVAGWGHGSNLSKILTPVGAAVTGAHVAIKRGNLKYIDSLK